MDSRERMNELQASIQNTKGFERLLDAIYECIGNYAYEIADDTSYSHTFVHIALQELVGVTDPYTAEEIDTAIRNLEG